MRQEENTDYEDFIEYFLSVVVGRRQYDKVKHTDFVSQYASKSDEALALLLLENSFDRWNDMYKNTTTKKSEVPPKFTNGGVSKGSEGQSKKYGD